MPEPADASDALEGELLDGPSRVRRDSPAPRPAPRTVDAWAGKAPKRVTRTMTVVALAPLLILPVMLLATRLPPPVRPILALVAIAATVYSYVRLRRPVDVAYQVDTTGVRMLTTAGDRVTLPYDSVDGLFIELTGDDAGQTTFVVTPRGPVSTGSVTKDRDGRIRIPFPQADAPRLDAAIRASGCAAYEGIVRR